ncbi:MAG: hypothetical protein HY763_05990 [Planctomycetes bacterium]|nr:hypothetical protein [Planctomycetota bacterium]
MAALVSHLTERGTIPALVTTLSFNQARMKVIAENVANWQTPDYRAKQLDVRGFQAALRDALDVRGSDVRRPLAVKSGQELRTDDAGRLRVTPSERPVDNVLFHDGTNLSIEREMADLAETGLTHELAATLLKGELDGLRKAIRGRI